MLDIFRSIKFKYAKTHHYKIEKNDNMNKFVLIKIYPNESYQHVPNCIPAYIYTLTIIYIYIYIYIHVYISMRVCILISYVQLCAYIGVNMFQ